MPVLPRLFQSRGLESCGPECRGTEVLGCVACGPVTAFAGTRFAGLDVRAGGQSTSAPHSVGIYSHASHAHRSLLLLSLLAVLSLGAVQAAPPAPTAASVPAASAPAPTPPAASVPAAIPNYGGRDSGTPALDTEAPNPAASAGRAVEALVIVLVGVVGVVYVLKRFGLVKPGANGQPAKISLTGKLTGTAGRAAADSPVTVVSSQTLPGGAMLHVVRVDDRNLLLAATPQTVTHLAEWPAGLGDAEDTSDFEDYLTRADDSPNSGIAAANARLRSLLSHPDSEEPS